MIDNDRELSLLRLDPFAVAAAIADTDGERDYAEENAVRAEQDAERASELAHELLQSQHVVALRDLASTAAADAVRTHAALAEELRLRLPANAHRYELLAQQQHLAHLASAASAALEATGSYDLVSVVEGVVESWLVRHSTGRDDQLGRAARRAASRVVAAIEATVREDAQRFADEAEQQTAVQEHERDLAAPDACRHEAWETTGGVRRCSDCREFLGSEL